MTGAGRGYALAVRVDQASGLEVVRVAGVIDLAGTPALRAVLFDRLADGSTRIVVDVSEVGLLDASGVGLLTAVGQRAEELGGSLCVLGARGRVGSVIEITGDAKWLGIYEDPADVLPGEPTQWHDHTIEALLGARLRQSAAERVQDWLRQEAIRYAHKDALRLARRYRGRGEALDDLVQVAMLGLLKAVDGYNPALGHPFLAYATPTIVGELRRHFRDRGWRVRVPRRLQELSMEIVQVRGPLMQALGRSPTVAELAHQLETGEHEILEALDASGGYRPVSLFAPLGDGAEESLADRLGGPDPGFTAVDNHESLRLLIAQLPLRQQRILALRFFGNRTQADIAVELGISQMHVSRLLARTLLDLRYALTED